MGGGVVDNLCHFFSSGVFFRWAPPAILISYIVLVVIGCNRGQGCLLCHDGG
jgi:hypothetical protein